MLSFWACNTTRRKGEKLQSVEKHHPKSLIQVGWFGGILEIGEMSSSYNPSQPEDVPIAATNDQQIHLAQSIEGMGGRSLLPYKGGRDISVIRGSMVDQPNYLNSLGKRLVEEELIEVAKEISGQEVHVYMVIELYDREACTGHLPTTNKRDRRRRETWRGES